MELDQGAAGTVSYDREERIVSLVWSDTTLHEDAVKEMLVRFGERAKAHPGSALLVDAREFNFAWGPEMDAWRDAAVVPTYNDAGVRRFAFVFKDVVPIQPPAQIPPASFETGVFHSVAEARAWLSAD